MENLIFSINSTLPVFLVMAAGWVLRRLGFLPPAFCTAADKLVFKVTLPIMLLCDMASVDLLHDFDGKYVGFCFGATIISILVIWGLAHRFLRDKTLVGEFVQCSYRSSAAILGVAFIQNIYGTAGAAPLMILGSVPLFNVFAVTILTVENPARIGKLHPSTVLRGVVTNPIILGIAAGAVVSLLPFELPVLVNKTFDSIASLTSPLALLSLGASFEGARAVRKLAPTLVAAFCKVVVLCAVFLPAAGVLGFRDQQLVALLVMLGSPTTPTSYIMAKNMGHEGVLSASVTVVTTLLSALTLTMWIFLLRSGGYIA